MTFASFSASSQIFPFEYDQHDFPNGLRLITVPTGYPHIVSLYIVVAVGSRNETEAGKSGFAHLFEHMMFRGTDAFPPERYEATLKRAGAAQNAYTDDDLTVYHTTFTREDLPAILAMEADRFQNLNYSEEAFRTETRAVLAEYNKDFAEPFHLLSERVRETAFRVHPYQHTTMGFLRDIERMPELYQFSRQFHDRYYRPERTTIILAGDVDAAAARALVEEHWTAWRRGSFVDSIPVEPPPEGPLEIHIPWPAHTLPLLQVAYHSPAYSDSDRTSAALDILSYLYFSETSELYSKLVLEDQSCDIFLGYQADHLDPYLYQVIARARNRESVPAVKEAIAATVPADKLERVKRHLRYAFAMRMDQSEGIAGLLARYVALRRTPETINALYEQYAQVTPEDLLQTARAVFTETNRVTALLEPQA
jgi:zinc protease